MQTECRGRPQYQHSGRRAWGTVGGGGGVVVAVGRCCVSRCLEESCSTHQAPASAPERASEPMPILGKRDASLHDPHLALVPDLISPAGPEHQPSAVCIHDICLLSPDTPAPPPPPLLSPSLRPPALRSSQRGGAPFCIKTEHLRVVSASHGCHWPIKAAPVTWPELPRTSTHRPSPHPPPQTAIPTTCPPIRDSSKALVFTSLNKSSLSTGVSGTMALANPAFMVSNI